MSDLGLTTRQVRFQNKAFWRNPAAAFFTFAFPLMFLVIFTSLFGNDSICLGEEIPGEGCPAALQISTSTFYVASITAFSVITACFTNIAMGVAFSREEGTLKRLRGTPLPGWSYLSARVVHAIFVTLLLVGICVAFGALFYDASVPTDTLPEFLVALVVGAAAFCALGLAATALIPNADAAPAVVNAMVLPLLFLSDVFIPLRENAPAFVEWIRTAFPVWHFVEALVAAYFPLPGEATFLWKDLLVVGAWGVAGILLAVRFFRWEPKGGR